MDDTAGCQRAELERARSLGSAARPRSPVRLVGQAWARLVVQAWSRLVCGRNSIAFYVVVISIQQPLQIQLYGDAVWPPEYTALINRILQMKLAKKKKS